MQELIFLGSKEFHPIQSELLSFLLIWISNIKGLSTGQRSGSRSLTYSFELSFFLFFVTPYTLRDLPVSSLLCLSGISVTLIQFASWFLPLSCYLLSQLLFLPLLVSSPNFVASILHSLVPFSLCSFAVYMEGVSQRRRGK